MLLCSQKMLSNGIIFLKKNKIFKNSGCKLIITATNKVISLPKIAKYNYFDTYQHQVIFLYIQI